MRANFFGENYLNIWFHLSNLYYLRVINYRNKEEADSINESRVDKEKTDRVYSGRIDIEEVDKTEKYRLDIEEVDGPDIAVKNSTIEDLGIVLEDLASENLV